MRPSRFLRLLVVAVPLALLFSALPANAAVPAPQSAWEALKTPCGEDLASRVFTDPLRPDVHVIVETLCIAPESSTLLEAPAAFAASADCTSQEYVLQRHRWNSPISYRLDTTGSGLPATDVLAAIKGGAAAWDDVTSTDIYGTITMGGAAASVGTRDSVNQMGFRSLGTTGVLARATTWFSSSGTAFESDVLFNSAYRWSTSGASGRADVQSVAAHEVGHSLGMDHPAQKTANACLTMYSSTPLGSTQGRTLGTGDILGIQAMYGAVSTPPPPPPPTPTPDAFKATFTPKAGNSWWVETSVTANRPLASVTASVDGASPIALSSTNWGTWARSFFVPDGSLVRFAAVATDGARIESGRYNWPTATPEGTAPPPPPTPEPWKLTFAPKPGNEWWVETRIDANRAPTTVHASVNSGTPIMLSQTAWGTWARSFHVPMGAVVTFTAASAQGERITSGGYSWPSATPVEDSSPLKATFTKHAGNTWWIEMRVETNTALTGVSVRIDGGPAIALDATHWGTWARSTHAPPGARLVFTATAEDGRTATSSEYTW